MYEDIDVHEQSSKQFTANTIIRTLQIRYLCSNKVEDHRSNQQMIMWLWVHLFDSYTPIIQNIALLEDSFNIEESLRDLHDRCFTTDVL